MDQGPVDFGSEQSVDLLSQSIERSDCEILGVFFTASPERITRHGNPAVTHWQQQQQGVMGETCRGRQEVSAQQGALVLTKTSRPKQTACSVCVCVCLMLA